MSLTAEERIARFIAMPKDRALNSYRAHKGKKTEIIKELAQRIGDVRALATPASVRLLNEKLKAFERKCEDIELAIDHLCTIAPERPDKLLAKLSAMTVEKIKINSEICEVYTAAPPETQNFLEPIKIAPTDTLENKVKIRTDLKPDTLSVDSTPVEYKLWAKSWRLFNLGSNYTVVSVLEQQQELLQLLDKALASKLQSKISKDTPIFPEQDHANAQARFKGSSVMEVLDKIFRESNPVFRQRCELIHLKPNKGEKFSSYMSRLIEMSEECDLHWPNYTPE